MLRDNLRDMPEVILSLLASGADVNSTDLYGNTALHYAVDLEFNDLVTTLIKKGSDIDALNDKLQSPLHIAAASGYLSLVKFLVDCGAYIGEVDTEAEEEEDLPENLEGKYI
jgi:ankyrin repeat protein